MSTNCPLIFVIILSQSNAIYVCTNLFGISIIIASLFCFASTTLVVMIASKAVVGLVASLREMYSRCMLPFPHILGLMFSSLFFSIKLYFQFFVVSLTLIGSKKLDHAAVAFLYSRQRYPFLQIY